MEQTYIEVKANGLVSAKKGANNRIPYAHQKAAMENLDIIDKESAYSTLVVLPTGAGKTYTAFQICWKLFKTKWNKDKTNRIPRILFLTDRNNLADQALILAILILIQCQESLLMASIIVCQRN